MSDFMLLLRVTAGVLVLVAVVATSIWGGLKWVAHASEQRCGLYGKSFGVATKWDATFGCHAKLSNGWHQVRTSP